MSLRSNIEKSKTKEECDPKTIIDPHEELFEPHEEISEESESTGKATPFVYMLVIAVCVGGFLAGYDTGVISGALTLLQQDFNMSNTEKELVVGGTTFGAIFGGFFSGLLTDRFGRKILVIVSSIIFIAGALILALAPSYGVLLFGRVVVGLAVGIASMIVPVFV
ncbi:hypothetical protein G6F42_021981 [Rhizopus arrhizus]|nr:hypothetical protein G6F42_021981 [Rhizopus arrhizus]